MDTACERTRSCSSPYKVNTSSVRCEPNSRVTYSTCRSQLQLQGRCGGTGGTLHTSSSDSHSARSSSVKSSLCGSTSTRCHAEVNTGSSGLRRRVWPGILLGAAEHCRPAQHSCPARERAVVRRVE